MNLKVHHAPATGQPVFVCFKCDRCQVYHQFQSYGATTYTNEDIIQILKDIYDTGKELCPQCKKELEKG